MKFVRPTKSSCLSCSDCSRMVSSGSARNATRASATTSSARCATRSVQWEDWRTGGAIGTGMTAATSEHLDAFRQQLELERRTDPQRLLGQIVHRQVHRQLV